MPEDKLTGGSYATQVKPDTYDKIVEFYEKEMKRPRKDSIEVVSNEPFAN